MTTGAVTTARPVKPRTAWKAWAIGAVVLAITVGRRSAWRRTWVR